MLSPTYEITTALSHTDELISPPYDIAIVTISYGRVTMSSVWDSMMSKKNMGWPFYAAVLCDQASKALFSMLKGLSRFVNLRPETMVDVFDKLIKPVLCYSAEVLRVKRCTQNDFVYGELGRAPMSIIRKITMVKYWSKIVHSIMSFIFKRIIFTLFTSVVWLVVICL